MSMPTEQDIASALQQYQDYYASFAPFCDSEGRPTLWLGLDASGEWDITVLARPVRVATYCLLIDPRRETCTKMATTLLNECLAQLA